ncbi:hypothetical protein IMZ48_07995 [Candidatus Bathyarchaeota archaeon]|nr:hypothetical protein [Candidatus Bathyarchaeota archaeon]
MRPFFVLLGTAAIVAASVDREDVDCLNKRLSDFKNSYPEHCPHGADSPDECDDWSDDEVETWVKAAEKFGQDIRDCMEGAAGVRVRGATALVLGTFVGLVMWS